jgi:hypothetical protein
MRSPVIVMGQFAFKIARNKRGRASNLYEANLYRNVSPARRVLLCPVLWVSPKGAMQIMRAAEPLTDMMSFDEYGEVVDAWDCMPGEDSCPFEPKASDWGWFEGRRVALDYSTPAWQPDGGVRAAGPAHLTIRSICPVVASCSPSRTRPITL